MTTHRCRFCDTPLRVTLADLGETPLANSYLPGPEAIAGERRFPLHVMVCMSCHLAQVTEAVPADAIFDHDYAYLSSFSSSWVAHAERYAEAMIPRFGLGAGSQVVEIASNDGYLLQHFVARRIPVLGVEPAGHAASLAEARGVPTRVAFFDGDQGHALRSEGFAADLIAANNVFAHVPDIRSFAAGFAALLKPQGVATFEFPHLLRLIEGAQFDTIYHEHYSYLSLLAVETVLGAVGLRVFDVEELPTHGGSLRVFACHEAADHAAGPGRDAVRAAEAAAGLATPAPYKAFAVKVAEVCAGLTGFLDRAAGEGKTVAAYGAAAKGNTLLNVAGVTSGIDFVVDRNPEKQGTLLPGSHIPVYDPAMLYRRKPGYVLILPWNLRAEIAADHAAIADWGGQFVVAVPELTVL
ncbi:MAG: class I SAM-dependent methyltransferase [Pseudomonadota bacterium]